MTSIEASTVHQLLEAAVARRPDALALSDAPNRDALFGGGPVRLTWTELDKAIDRLAHRFSELGVGPGDKVGIQLPNVVELVVSILACVRVGAVAVPFPIQHRSHELRTGMNTVPLSLMVTGARPDRPDQLDTVAEVAADFGVPVAVFGDAGPEHAPLAISNAASDTTSETRFEPHRGVSDDVVTVCWTSGTTGVPKGVPRTNSMWLASSRTQVERVGITADDRMLCPFPVVNMAGIGGMLMPWLQAGAAIHLHQPLDLEIFMAQIQGESITYTVAPPPLLNMLLRNEALLNSVDLSSIRAISSGSAPLDPWMVQGWQERGIEIINVFGSNEGAALLSTMASVPDPLERARYFPVPDSHGIEVRLVDLADGTEIRQVGTPGELRFRGPTVFDGYIDSDGREFDEQGYYRTGDVFQWAGDAEPPALLQFVDRAKDIIIRGGMNISAAEVEALVSSHDDVVECAAVAFPDPDLGEKLGVFVVPAPGTTPTLEQIVAHLRRQEIASYKLPERLELIESLPRNAVGKVTKPTLRDAWPM